MNTFTKGLVMTIVALIASTIQQKGFPVTTVGWEVLAITTAGTSLTYIAKNFAFPSISIAGVFDMRDLLSGVIVGVGAALSSLAATSITGTVADFKSILVLVGSVIAGYFAKTIVTPATPTK